MHIIALKALREFWEKHPQAQTPLRAWHAEASRAGRKTLADIKAARRNASFLPDNRVVFNIKGNDYRLVVKVFRLSGLLAAGATAWASWSAPGL